MQLLSGNVKPQNISNPPKSSPLDEASIFVAGESRSITTNSIQSKLYGGGITTTFLPDNKLMKACKEGNVEMLKDALNSGARINHNGGDKARALHHTCYGGHVECVKLLLASPDIDVNKTDSQGSAALHYVLKNRARASDNLDECARILIDDERVDVDIINKSDEAAIVLAVRQNFPLDVIEKLTNRKCYLESVDKESFNAFGAAVRQRRLDVYELLKARGANVEKIKHFNEKVIPLLYLACQSSPDSVDFVSLLIKDGTHIDAKTSDSREHTALFMAIEREHLSYVKQLIQAGADVNMQDLKAVTPLMFAASVGNIRRVTQVRCTYS